jgi:DNA-binding NtrC family response regulator
MNEDREHEQAARLLGWTPTVKRLKRQVRFAASRDHRMLLVGEPGVGKSTIVRMIHFRSERRGHPLVCIDCRELGDSVSWADVLGEVHESGEAVRRRTGALERVGAGTLYLSNIDALTLEDQRVFFSILNSGSFRRGTRSVELDARVLASMENDPSRLIAAGRFRRELYVYFGGVAIYIPPLRERVPDMFALLKHYLEIHCQEHDRPTPTVPGDVFKSMLHYDWPGNVRELGDTVRNMLVMSPIGELSGEYLPFMLKNNPLEAFLGLSLRVATAKLESFLIERTLRKFGWNQARAARSLGLSEPNLRYRMKRHKIDRTF